MKIIKLEQPNCRPCMEVSLFLDSMGVKYESINILEQPHIAAQYGIMSTPVTILLDDNGNEVQRVVGNNRDELQKMISKLQ
jgi:thioredoxin 1